MVVSSPSYLEQLTGPFSNWRVLSLLLLGGECAFALITLTPARASAQEALQNSLAGEAAAEARHQTISSQRYTIKSGDFRLYTAPSLGLEWNDNINTSKTNAIGDFILKPTLQLDASYPLTQWNLLTVNVGFGYDKYLEHNQRSKFRINTDSGLSFDMYIKDFWINVYDRVSFVQDVAEQPTLANSANYSVINNRAGVTTTWDLQDLTLSLGYDHQNVFPQSSQYDYLSRSTESVVQRTGLRVHPQVTLGATVTAAFTSYDQRTLNNNDAYSIGPYVTFQPGTYFTVQVYGGYAVYLFQNTSSTIQTSDVSSWYAGLSLTHQITDYISYSLRGGRQSRLGTQSDLYEYWYISPSVNWKILENLNLNTSLSYQNGSQGQGNVYGNFTEDYNWLAWSTRVSYPIMQKLSASLSYRLTVRTSNTSNYQYTQNLLGIQLTYMP